MKKKKYVKPSITQIRLITDEMMASGCKQSGGSGGKNNRCPPISVNACKNNNGS